MGGGASSLGGPSGAGPGRAGEVERLQRETRRLSDEIKRLVKTERQLYEIQEHLDGQIRAYRHLYEIGKKFNAALDLETIVRLAAHFVLYELDFERCLVLLRRSDIAGFSVAGKDGYYDGGESRGIAGSVLRDESRVLALLRAGCDQVLCAPDCDSDELCALRPLFGMDEYVVLPLGGEPTAPVGLLVAGNTAPKAHYQSRIVRDSESMLGLANLASQTSTAISNANSYRALERERQFLEEKVAERTQELEAASRHKSEFLANMSHELRTPLNAILGYAELLVDGIYGEMPEKPKGVLERIQNNGRHLLALINDVLDLAKIEAGQLTLSLEDYSVPELVRSVVTATEPLAAAKGLKFAALLPADMPTAHGDARRISQVLLNLVGNAIKFTDEGEVEIAAAAADGHFTLTVRDTGPGIAAADQERIFGEFQQIDNSNTRKKGGTGLGLAISKRMVEMQGGTIVVESAPGQGSTFRVTLPVYVEEPMEATA